MLKMTIKNRLIIAFLAILILPSSAIGWFAYQKAKTEVTAQIENNAIQSVKFANDQITDLISSNLSDVDYMAKEVNASMIDGNGNPKIRQVLDPYKAVHPSLETVFFAGKDGLFIISPDKKMDAGFDATKRPWFIKANENKGKGIIADPLKSAVSGNVIINVAKTTDDGAGIAGTSIDLGKLSKQVSSIKVGQKGYITILDKDRKYVVHPTIEAGSENKEAFVNKFYEKDSGIADFVFNGVNKRAAFAVNPLTGWRILGSIELSEIAAATQGILYTTLAVIGISILIGVLLVLWIIRSITLPLKELISTTEKIADGDLTKEVDIRSKDELGQLAASVNHMVHKLRGLITGVVSSSQNVAAASQQISATTEEIAGANSAQSQAAQNMQELFSELSTAINSVAGSADEAAELAAKSTSIAQDGGAIVKKSVDSMNQVNTQMTKLEEDSAKIGDIIEVIDDIAAQTNLLALNAAIEAARAGEQGRGFAVVADEVRKLAERSGEATKQITDIIKGMQENTHKSVLAVSDGVKQTQETGEAFDRIVQMINETEQKVSEIAAASEEQAAQSNDVMHSIESISSASEEAAAASQETAATSQSLAQLAEDLSHSVSVFKIS